jgi:hypothetical protein
MTCTGDRQPDAVFRRRYKAQLGCQFRAAFPPLGGDFIGVGSTEQGCFLERFTDQLHGNWQATFAEAGAD